MDSSKIKIGMNVKIIKLEKTTGMLVSPEYLYNRKQDAEGTVLNYIAGHGGDCWWIKHTDGKIAAYCFTEFEPIN